MTAETPLTLLERLRCQPRHHPTEFDSASGVGQRHHVDQRSRITISGYGHGGSTIDTSMSRIFINYWET